jgi:CheY-like chemotaxis protein
LLLVADGQPNPPLPPTALVGARVLLVDTQLACRRINSERMTTWGMQVQTADSLRTCLDQVQRASQEQRPFRFVIIALSRTEYDGPALVERLRTDATLNDMTVIALVGSAEREVFKRRLGKRCAGYLPLPVRVRDLQELMVYQLTASHEERARSAPVSERFQCQHEVRFANTVRVLMAEDNPVNQLVGRGILRKLGIEQVDIVGNGFEALHALSEKRYDLVLMDMQMPEMDGLEATRAIRDPTSMVIDHAIPILALTANARSEDQVECSQAGMNGFVSKPINVTQLATALSAWLKAV